MINGQSYRAKDRARDWWRQGMDFDAEYTINDAEHIAGLMGITIEDILYTGFSSQGDGAMFLGSYKFMPGAKSSIKKHAPKDADLSRIMEDLTAVQKRNANKIVAEVSHSGDRYYHSRIPLRSMSVERTIKT